jgi:hypothetical protein
MNLREKILDMTEFILINYSDTAYKEVSDDIYLEKLPHRLLELRNSKDVRFRVLDIIDFKDENDVRFSQMTDKELEDYYSDLKWLKDELGLVFKNFE